MVKIRMLTAIYGAAKPIMKADIARKISMLLDIVCASL